MCSPIFVFQHVIFLSQNVILTCQLEICVQVVPNYMHGVLLRVSGWELKVGCHLALAFGEIHTCNLGNRFVCMYTHIYWHLKYFPNETGQEIAVFPMCKMIKGSRLFWVSAKCLFLGSVKEITTHGAKNAFTLSCVLQGWEMGNKARFPFPEAQKQDSE